MFHVVLQGAMFPPMGAPQQNAMNPASNPFYNMAPQQQQVPVSFPQANRVMTVL